jgi:hypothetical protein
MIPMGVPVIRCMAVRVSFIAVLMIIVLVFVRMFVSVIVFVFRHCLTSYLLVFTIA